MTGLFKLAHDPSSAARKGVCTGLVQLLHLQPERLAPHLPDIIEYMLRSMQARTLRPAAAPSGAARSGAARVCGRPAGCWELACLSVGTHRPNNGLPFFGAAGQACEGPGRDPLGARRLCVCSAQQCLWNCVDL
jgi:hypothetical protein